MFKYCDKSSNIYVAELSEASNCQNEMSSHQNCSVIIMVMRFSFSKKYARYILPRQLVCGYILGNWFVIEIHDTSL